MCKCSKTAFTDWHLQLIPQAREVKVEWVLPKSNRPMLTVANLTPCANELWMRDWIAKCTWFENSPATTCPQQTCTETNASGVKIMYIHFGHLWPKGTKPKSRKLTEKNGEILHHIVGPTTGLNFWRMLSLAMEAIQQCLDHDVSGDKQIIYIESEDLCKYCQR